jgi:hypothetical protein
VFIAGRTVKRIRRSAGTGTAPIGTASPTAGTDVSWTAGFAPRPPASLGEHEVIRRPELDGDRVRPSSVALPKVVETVASNT